MVRLLTILSVMLITITVDAQLNNGLVAHWDFNSNTNDVSGNGHNGTAYNINYTNGKAGAPNTAARFNGTNSYVFVPYQSDLNMNQYSICALIKPTGYYTGVCQVNVILARGVEPQQGYYRLCYMDNIYDNGNCNLLDTSKEVFMTNAGNVTEVNALNSRKYTPTIVTQNWYCVVGTFDGSQYKLYVNGVLKATTAISSGTIGSTTDALAIGAYKFGPQAATFPYWLNGVLDDLRLYNRALSQNEVDSFCNLFSTPIVTPEVSISQPISPTSFCPGDNFLLYYTVTSPFKTGNIFTAQLSDATGSFASPVNIGSVTATGPGVISCTIPANTPQGTGYRVRILASNPSKLSADNGVNLTVNEGPQVSIYGDTAVCINDTLKLYTQVTPPGTNINWKGPGSFSSTSPNIIIPNANYSDSGRYVVTADNNGCKAYDTVYAIVDSLSFKLGNDTTLCEHESLLLYTGTKGTSLLWSDGSTADTFKVQTGGTFFVTATLGSCSLSDTIKVEIKYVQVMLPTDTTVCPGSLITISVADTFDKYIWNTGATTPSVTLDTSGIFWLTAFKGPCYDIDSFSIKHMSPYFLLGNDTTVCKGSTLTLFAQSLPDSRYVWQDGTTGPEYNVTLPGFYHVTAHNMCGIFASNIEVDFYPCECNPFVPSAFTPDGNGLNDKIGPILDCKPVYYRFLVVNRRGQVVFETEKYGDKWDGRYKTIPSGMDTYFYMIQTTDVLGNKTIHKGDFLLLR